MDNILLNKAAIIERCLLRIHEEYANDPQNLRKNFTKQDSIILNLERACEASIDIAMHMVRKNKLGIPQDSRDSFDLLTKAKLIDQELSSNLNSMVGFRNIAVHDYQNINLDIVQAIIENRLKDLQKFAAWAINQVQENNE